jgi:ABC-type multidrug transport system fused ATPase/permease subunit
VTVATQRLRGEARPANSIVQIISILGARRRELRASVGERLRLLDARALASEPRLIGLAERLAGLEERLEGARLAQSQRAERRRERIGRLKDQLEILRGPTQQVTENARVHQLGSVLIYVGGLAVLWVVLLELGLALGLS